MVAAFSPHFVLPVLHRQMNKRKTGYPLLFSHLCNRSKSYKLKKVLNHPSSLASYKLWAILVVGGADKPLNLWALAMQSMREWVSVWTFSCLPTPGTHGKQGVDPTGIKHALLISPELRVAPRDINRQKWTHEWEKTELITHCCNQQRLPAINGHFVFFWSMAKHKQGDTLQCLMEEKKIVWHSPSALFIILHFSDNQLVLNWSPAWLHCLGCTQFGQISLIGKNVHNIKNACLSLQDLREHKCKHNLC